MIVIVYFIFRLQGVLPLNPAHIEGMEPTLAFNTAISFMADTNLQHYSGENGLSYLSQLIGITFLMFAAPATTLALVMAFIRGLAGKELGNFFVDFTRALTSISSYRFYYGVNLCRSWCTANVRWGCYSTYD